MNYEKVGKEGRPVYNTIEIVPITMDFSLNQVLAIKTDTQVFDFVGMITLVSVLSLNTCYKLHYFCNRGNSTWSYCSKTQSSASVTVKAHTGEAFRNSFA